jgi:predicted kinase
VHEQGGAGRLIVLCGLPGSGKTTVATRLEHELGALRLCPDEWMRALAIDLWDGPARERVEALQWRLAQDALRLGCIVIIEWGVWARSERDTLRLACRTMGAAVELRYLDVPLDELAARVEARQGVDPMDVAIERRHLEEWVDVFEAPEAQELALFDPPLNR